jgi:hypothetical protein
MYTFMFRLTQVCGLLILLAGLCAIGAAILAARQPGMPAYSPFTLAGYGVGGAAAGLIVFCAGTAVHILIRIRRSLDRGHY